MYVDVPCSLKFLCHSRDLPYCVLTVLLSVCICNQQRALSAGLENISSTEVRLRAGKLLTAVVEYTLSQNDSSSYAQFIKGLNKDLFSSFLRQAEAPQRDVATLYLHAVGQAMGHRDLASIVAEQNLTDALEAQRMRYVTAVATTLSNVTSESVAINSAAAQADATPAPSRPATVETNPVMERASSTVGYIPTVPGINSNLPATPTSVGDDQLHSVLAGLAAFLSRDENRHLFCGDITSKDPTAKPVAVLAGLLEKDVGLPVQVYYQSIFCLWLLSFASQHNPSSRTAEKVAKAMADAAVPRRLTGVLREVWAEKVIRISLSTLRNLMKMSVLLRKDMVGAGLVAALETLCLRRWNDEDIREDLGVLADALESEHASMSTFDVYRAEILSGALEWTPPHRDETFWQQNVEKLESNNLEVLRCIVRVLNESTDNTVLSVACHDLAQFVRHHPRGRQIAQSLGVKGRLMELMATGEGDVRRYALNGVQVLMITHWNLMQRSA